MLQDDDSINEVLREYVENFSVTEKRADSGDIVHNDEMAELVVEVRLLDILEEEIHCNTHVDGGSGMRYVNDGFKPLFDTLKSELSYLIALLNTIHYRH